MSAVGAQCSRDLIEMTGALAGAPVELEGPISVTPDDGVTHLRYRVRR